MPAKRARPPGLYDGKELGPALKKASTPSKTKSSPAKNGRASAPSTPSKSAAKTTPKSSPAPKVVKNRLKVGVDFGTTNSGVAHVMLLNSEAKDVEVIKNWPGGLRNNEQLEKVPSRIAFVAENESINEDKWGYEVPAGLQSYTWFKLLLDTASETALLDSDEMAGKMESGLLELPEGMNVGEVTATYLSKLYDHTMEVLRRRHTTNILEVTPIDFWFTVPANWQEDAIDATRTAAEIAGFGSRVGDQLSIITEPEAAAIAVLSIANDNNPALIEPGKNVLICNLGGGTLDFQVLTITELEPHLKTEETIPGVGAKAGSAYIDCNFYTWAEATFGDAFKELPKQKTGVGSKFMNEWEVVKRTFTGKDLKKVYQVPFPALGTALRDRDMESTSYDLEDHSVLISGAEIAEMFKPVIKKAFALIDKLCKSLKDKRMKGIQIMCLCGGLGSSEYIWDKFEKYAEKKIGQDCAIFKDDRAWSAVVRGAAIRGLSGSVVLSKKAKRAFGVGIHQAFRNGFDKEEDAEECPIMGKRAHGYVLWPVKVSQRFEENSRVKTNLYVTIPENADEEDLIFQWQLYSCALENAPLRHEHPDVKEEATITLDLSSTHRRSRRDDASPNNYEAVQVAIVFKMGNQRGTLMVEALHGRKVLGTAKIDYTRTQARRVITEVADLLDD